MGFFPGKNTAVGYHFLLQGICPNSGIKPASIAGGFFITSARWETHELVGCLNQVPQTQWLKQRVFAFSQAGGCNVRSGAGGVGFFRDLSPWACRRPLFHCVHLSSLL